MSGCINYEPYGEEWKAQLRDIPKDLIIEMFSKVGKEKDDLFLELQRFESVEKDFHKDLTILLNKHCKENASNTPDYILANYIKFSLRAFNVATNQKKLHEMGIEINKDDGDDFITCESCTKQCTDIESMECDNDSNWFCPECWAELAPVMRKEWEDLKANGEIESND